MLSVVPSIIATTIPRKEMPLLHKRITTPMNFYLTRWKAVPVKAYLIFIIKSQFFSVSRFIMSLLVFVLRVETWPSPESIQVQSLVKQSLKLFLYTPYAHISCSTSIWSFAYKSEYYSSRREIFSKLGWIPKQPTYKTLSTLKHCNTSMIWLTTNYFSPL